ncbi:hypothetical protein ENBRE01_0718 [Enteropsectra breve]|nr:hypothetical protein ENBRE01_0718 [Enteropsectra breve]
MRLISVMMILLSQLSASIETMLIETTVLEKRIENGLACCVCLEIIEKTNETLECTRKAENEYQKYNFKYFSCPQCKHMAHTKCLLDVSPAQLKCPNPACSLLFKDNEISKFFAHILYVCISKNESVDTIETYFNAYLPFREQKSVDFYLDILIESATIPEFGTYELRKLLKPYNKAPKESMTHLRLVNTFQNVNKANILKVEEKNKKSFPLDFDVIPFLLYKSQNMWMELCECSTHLDVISIYEEYVYSEKLADAKQHFTNIFMYFIMKKPNAFKFMEELAFPGENNTGNVSDKQPATSILKGSIKECNDEQTESHLKHFFSTINSKCPMIRDLQSSLLAELERSHICAIIEKIEIYMKNKSKGILIPAFIEYFNSIGMQYKAKEITFQRLKPLDENKTSHGVSIDNDISAFCMALQLNIKFSIWEIDILISWVQSIVSTLDDRQLCLICSCLEKFIGSFENKEQKKIQDIFVKGYTKDMARIYVRCMPSRFYTNKTMKMLDFLKKRSRLLKRENVVDSDLVALDEHKELIKMRNAYENEQKQANN